jgi:acetyl/propionyl-CoA carboxylase alpha subunit
MIESVLIAERGEAAARVARSCKRLGIRVIGLRGEDSSSGVHVAACDETFTVATDEAGKIPADAVVKAATEAKVQAVHPGHAGARGQLALATALAESPIHLVGPSLESLTRLASPAAVRASIAEAGFAQPACSGAFDGDHDPRPFAAEIPRPWTLRAAEGETDAFAPALADEDALLEEVVKRTRDSDASLVVEQGYFRARVLEVPVLVDQAGTQEPLPERECSITVSGQRLLEESPSPALIFHAEGEAIRSYLLEAACAVTRSLGASGLLIVRFAMNAEGRLMVIGVRPGLPVQDAITGMTTGLDLVEFQLEIASGKPLPARVTEVEPTGHGLGAWLVAPSNETFDAVAEELRWPPFPQGKVRTEPSASMGSTVPPDDRPRIAKLTTYAPTRHQALLLLDRVLTESRIEPYQTNKRLLGRILADEAFRAGRYDADFVRRLLTAPA